jgi:predicted metal-dependent hydrolase
MQRSVTKCRSASRSGSDKPSPWIKRHRTRFDAQARESARELVSGESHYFLGRRYRLRVIYGNGTSAVRLQGHTRMEMRVRPGTRPDQRERLLNQWYRGQLRKLIPPLLEKWQSALGVAAAEWGIKRMKTKWGTCNPEAQLVWLNLELAKKPVQCLDYIIVHELVHLVEIQHNERFVALMDKHLPQWRRHRQELNSAPLGHASWSY